MYYYFSWLLTAQLLLNVVKVNYKQPKPYKYSSYHLGPTLKNKSSFFTNLDISTYYLVFLGIFLSYFCVFVRGMISG